MFSRFKSFDQIYMMNEEILERIFKYKWNPRSVQAQKKCNEISDKTVDYFSRKYNLNEWKIKIDSSII